MLMEGFALKAQDLLLQYLEVLADNPVTTQQIRKHVSHINIWDIPCHHSLERQSSLLEHILLSSPWLL